MDSSVHIVDLKPYEWEAYKNLRLQALQKEPHAFASTYEENLKEPDHAWRVRLENALRGDGQWLSFAKKGNELVGMVGAFSTDDPTSVEIISLFVTKDARGQGIGKKLLTSIIKKIKQNETIKKIHLDVNTEQKSAIALYESCGFTLKGKRKTVLGDGKAYNIVMLELVNE